ncbi:MAG: gliding motility-associated C-terminal domain-containing protein [Bacteroidetes bacterium]|nr:gliding motility-associated C-terminal domain-containing protein [Bacteroidota bacterium]
MMYFKKRFLGALLVVLCLYTEKVCATHIVGGNLAYEYQGNVGGNLYRYKVTFKTFIDCNSPFWGNGFPETFLQVGVYEGSVNPPSLLGITQTLNMPLTNSFAITPEASSNCSVGASTCVYECTYEATIDLPLTFQGYHLFYDRCCRVNTILNLSNSGNQGHSYHAFIPPSLVANDSPVFSDSPIPFMCVNDTVTILNTAFDADGDVLIFSFEDPYVGFGTQSNPAPNLPLSLNWPIPPVTWQTGYNKNIPFGASGYAYINSSTGFSRYYCNTPGEYVIAVEIKEYRNGNLIGISRRDFQILVINCPNNPPPALSTTSGSGLTSYVITEGDSLCFPVIFYDQFGDSISLSANGQLFSGSYTNPAASFTNNVKGDSVVSANFCWPTVCGQARPLPYLFFVSVKDNGCPNKTTSMQYSIQVNPFQGPSAINGPTNVCFQTTGSQYNVTNISGATYAWSVTGGTQTAGSNTNAITIDWGAIGNGTVSVTTTSKDGCIATPISKVVTINSLPTANAGNDSSLCSNKIAQLGAATTAGYTYSWTLPNLLNNGTTSNPTATITNTSISTQTTAFVLTVTDANNCQDIDSVLVSTFPAPTIDAGPTVSICTGNTAQLSGSGAGIFNWSPSGGLSSTSISNPIVTTTSTTTYSLLLTDLNGCTNTDSTTVTINTPIPVDAGISSWVCPGDSIQLLATGVTSYQWQPTTGLNSSIINNPKSSPNATINYTVEGTDVNGCTSIDTVEVAVASNVPVDAGSGFQICKGNSIVIGGNPTAPANSIYAWTPVTSLNNTTIANPLANPAGSTMYYLTVTNDTCSGRDSVFVTILPSPVAFAGTDTAFCLQDSIQLQASGGVSFSWTPANGLSNSQISNPWVDTTLSSSYIVTVTDLNGCTANDTILVNVNPLPNVDAGVGVNLCNGLSVTLNATGAATYNWSPNNGLSSTSIANPTANPTGTTTYTVIGTDNNNCINSDTTTITLIVFTISIPDTFTCVENNVPLIATTSNASSYDWSPGATLNDSTIFNPIAAPTVNTTYSLTAINSAGCIANDTVQVLVKANPTADYTYSLTPSCDGMIVSFTNQSVGASNYNWIWGDGNSSSLANASYVLPYNQNHNPQLIAENLFGCKDSYSSAISISDFKNYLIYNSPNVFTPNFDGANDNFNIQLNGYYLGCTNLKIFNRYGVLLFEADRFNHSWDGRTTAGLEVPEGTYFYVYTINDLELKGFVTLLR